MLSFFHTIFQTIKVCSVEKPKILSKLMSNVKISELSIQTRYWFSYIGNVRFCFLLFMSVVTFTYIKFFNQNIVNVYPSNFVNLSA